jgi:hypothetical protein
MHPWRIDKNVHRAASPLPIRRHHADRAFPHDRESNNRSSIEGFSTHTPQAGNPGLLQIVSPSPSTYSKLLDRKPTGTLLSRVSHAASRA